MKTHRINRAAIRAGVKAAGGISEMARKLTEITGQPVSYQRIQNWLNRDATFPPEMCIPFERACERAATRYELRPDCYPREEVA